MIKFYISLLLVSILNIGFAQKTSIIDEFNDAEDFLNLVEKRTNFAFDYIRKATNEDSFEYMKNYCKRAKNEAEYCKKQSLYAADEIFNVKEDMRELSCNIALEKSEAIDLLLNDAKSIFDDAYNEFRKAEYAENQDDLEIHLQKGKKYLQESLEKVRTAQSNIEFAKESIHNCY